MRSIFASIILAATSIPPGPGAIEEGRSAVQEETLSEVCGVMDHDRVESFANEAAAKAAGASRVIYGPCFDED